MKAWPYYNTREREKERKCVTGVKEWDISQWTEYIRSGVVSCRHMACRVDKCLPSTGHHLPDTMDVLNGVTDFSPELLLVKHNLKEKERLHNRDLPLYLCGIYRVSRELVGTCYLKIKVVFPDIQTNFISSKADKTKCSVETRHLPWPARRGSAHGKFG